MSKQEFIDQQVDIDLKYLYGIEREFVTNPNSGFSSVKIKHVLQNIEPLYMRPAKIGKQTYSMYLADQLNEQLEKEEADNERHNMKENRKPESDLKYPFKSKYSKFRDANNIEVEQRQKLPDMVYKHYTKGLMKPIFSFVPGAYQADLLTLSRNWDNEIKGYILFLININTKYVYTKQLAKKDMNSVTNAFNSAIKKIRAAGLPITIFKSDAETTFQSMKLDGVQLMSSGSPYTNHVRIVDRVIRTFRDAMGVDTNNSNFDDYNMVKKLCDYYNKTPHRALRMYGKTYTPLELQSNEDLEWSFIRLKISQLQQVRQNLKNKGLLDLVEGNILLCSLDTGKVETFIKKRRVFDKLAMFLRYHNGNAIIRFLHPRLLEARDVPLYQCSFLCNSFEDLLNTHLGKMVINTFNCNLGKIAALLEKEPFTNFRF